MKKWVCKVCGYIYEGPEAPVECPVCHAKNAFNEVQGEIKVPRRPRSAPCATPRAICSRKSRAR